MPFTILEGNIVQMKVDAVVNAANTSLIAGGGVCGAIFAAAGHEKLQDACDDIGYCATGDAVITKGYALPAKYIIHTAGPIYGQNPKKEAEELYSCYRSSLRLAQKKRLSSVAFPLISTGIYGYPKKEAFHIATRAIRDFLNEHEEMAVYLVLYDRSDRLIEDGRYQEVAQYLACKTREVSPSVAASLWLEEEKSDAAPTASASFAPRKHTSYSAPAPSDASREDSALPPQNALRPADSLDSLLKKKVETFSQMLLRLIDEKGMTDVEVYKRANLDRKHFSKIRKRDYRPKKATVMALIIALRLDLKEAQELLARAGFAFSEACKTDLIIEYFIEHKIYDIFELNETLFAFEQPLLGAS